MFSFRSMDVSDLHMVLDWRTSPFVARFMLTDIEYDLEVQRNWFDKITADPSCCYWLINWQKKAVGVINLAGIDLAHKTASWAFYLGDENLANLGGLLPPYLYNFVFLDTDLTTLNAEVMSENQLVIKLHRLHGYEVLSERDTQKNGMNIKVTNMRLTRESWLTRKKFHRYRADFPLKPGIHI